MESCLTKKIENASFAIGLIEECCIIKDSENPVEKVSMKRCYKITLLVSKTVGYKKVA